MKLSTRIMAALVLGVVAGLLLGADGAEFAKTWIVAQTGPNLPKRGLPPSALFL